MTNAEIVAVLKENGVRQLYHANTVTTSHTFITHGGLLSRKYCVDNHLPQTSQYTDYEDRRYGIFNDIFFDSSNIQNISGINLYGPVLFVYNIGVLNTVNEQIKITKMNPDKWRGFPDESDRYFTTLSALRDAENGFSPNNFGCHITITQRNRPLSFDCLEEIILSIPDAGLFEDEENVSNLITSAERHIRTALTGKGINLTIRRVGRNNKNFYKFYSTIDNLNKHYGIFR